MSDEEVAEALTTWAGRVAAGEARLMAYIGEFDERRAWAVYGILSCAHWLSWRLGMGQNAAGERVRVARALRQLPETSAAFAAGQLSFTQVRAISRVATPEDEQTYIGMARHATGGQLERLVSGVRRAQKLLKGRKAVERIRVFTRYDDDGDLCITIRAGAADGAILLAAVEAARTDLDAGSEKDEPNLSAERSDAPEQATRGDGLLQLCRAYLDERATAHPARARRDRSHLTVQIDPISGWSRLPDGEFLPPGSLAVSLTAHDLGRQSRHPSQPLRDLLGAVDGERCRYPSCTRRRKLHAHHVIKWSDGGPTDLANLALVCSRHHTLVHAEGIRLKLNPATRALTVTTAAGSPVPHRAEWPWLPAEGLDPSAAIHPTTLPPFAGDKLDLHYAVEVLMQHAA
ncbi:MAG TPA: DUF222 domain-containing protein [Frankiaceae bacterium]|nr:DUF222 domain-containing protein [Frankiaceae bacterium]